MKDILQKWLQEILGLIVELEKLDGCFRDGTVFVRILQHYCAINLNTVDIHPSQDNIVRRINLIQLKAWFKLLNIDFNNEIIEDILRGKISTCINVLYQLYLCFENKTSLNFLPKQKERLMKKSDKKFKVTDFSLSDIQQNKYNCKNDNHYKYSDRILENNDIIGWYRDKHVPKKKKSSKTSFLVPINDKTNKLSAKDSKCASIKKSRFEEDVYYVRNKLDRYYTVNNRCNYHDYNISLNYNYIGTGDESSSSKFSKTSKLNRCTPDPCLNKRGHFLPPISAKDGPSALSYGDTKDNLDDNLKILKCRIRCSFKKRQISKKMCDYVVNDVWSLILDREEDNLKKIIGRKLIKQSVFEKVWAMRLFQVMNQSEVQKRSYAELKCHVENVSRLNNDFADCESSEIDDEDNLLSFHDYVLYYHNERRRTVELHRRLYAEKLKLTFQKHYALCLQTVEDIVDISIKISEFKEKYEMPITDRLWTLWKQLFYHGLPVYINDYTFPLKAHENENDKADLYEYYRERILNASDLDDYLNIDHEWMCIRESDDMDIFSHGFSKNSEHLLIGYVVHRLLQMKYPSRPVPTPSDIPRYPIRVILNDMNDKEAIIKFRTLLINAEILVVDVNTAVNFCLNCYKNEIGLESTELFNKIFLQNSSSRGSIISSSADSKKSKELDEKFKEQSTQTSQFISTDAKDSFLSEKAVRLGGELFNAILFGGNELSTTLIVDTIIEYIKNNQGRITGWVLVNFPSTLFQASVLENALTGKRFPYFLEEEKASESSSDIGPLKDARESATSNIEISVPSSRIVPNPRECDGDDIFKTYFSKFLTTVKGETKLVYSNEGFSPGLENYSMHSESTLLLEHPEREGVPTINEFYRDQGISYEFIYEKYDLNTLKNLAHLIFHQTVEDNIQIPSVDLFSKDILDKLMNIDENITGQNEDLSTKPVENLVLPSLSKHSDLLSFDRHDLSICSENFDKGEAVSKPGDKSWVYANDSIPENLGIALATFWEVLETTYLNDLINVFSLKRNTEYDLIPYIHYTTKIMELSFNQKDNRQTIVTDFLNHFNAVHVVLRSDEDMKLELHLRVTEFRDNLIKLCQDEQDCSEHIRKTLINQNWTYLQLAAICNCFISMLQIEADRCTRTLRLLKDYYYTMLGVFKVEPLSDDLSKLSKVALFVEESEENAVAAQIIHSLLDPTWSSTSLESSIYNIFDNKANEMCSAIEQIKSVIDNVIIGEEANAVKIHKELFSIKQKELEELEKKQRQSKDFRKRKSRANSEDALKEINGAKKNLLLEAEKKELSVKNFFLEWSTAVKVEVERALFRIGLIKRRAFIDLTDIELNMARTFNHFNDLVVSKLERELDCIDQLCTLFHWAIEEKTPVHGDIIFQKDTLFMLKRDFEKAEAIIKLPPGLEEMLFEESFTIKQLEEMKNRLVYVAPSGIISHEAFVTLIETMIIQGTSNGSIKLVPNVWSKLRSDEYSILFRKVFGNCGLVPWRDFLIHCLDLPYPVTEDLIDAKLQFLYHDPQGTETVTYEDFMSITLWFHRELPESPLQALHNILAKEFLFSLYRVQNEDLINYMSLLLAFCKDEDVRVGFGKGLSLLYGRCVIVFEEDLFLEKILTDHIGTGSKIVKDILGEIIEDVVTTAFGIIDVTESQIRYREQRLSDVGLRGIRSLDVDNEISDFYPQLTESMYDQFFRRHRTLRWTSKVPFVVVITLVTTAFYPIFIPYYVRENYSNLLEEVRSQMTDLQEMGEDYVYVPLFLENDWLKTTLQRLTKFKSLSFTNVIKGIFSARKLN